MKALSCLKSFFPFIYEFSSPMTTAVNLCGFWPVMTAIPIILFSISMILLSIKLYATGFGYLLAAHEFSSPSLYILSFLGVAPTNLCPHLTLVRCLVIADTDTFEYMLVI
jgi:hypothetical protein